MDGDLDLSSARWVKVLGQILAVPEKMAFSWPLYVVNVVLMAIWKYAQSANKMRTEHTE